MEKKSTSRANWSAINAAEGTSIIVPTGKFGLNATPSSSRSSLTSASSNLHCRSSKSVLTIGNMIRTLPRMLARRMARSCVLNRARLRRHSLTLRTPKNGLRSFGEMPTAGLNLSAPRSSVRTTTGCPFGNASITSR